MDVEYIRSTIERIRSLKDDLETSHLVQDILLSQVLVSIATGDHAVPAQELAREVLKVTELD